jgi:hypothetical protein
MATCSWCSSRLLGLTVVCSGRNCIGGFVGFGSYDGAVAVGVVARGGRRLGCLVLGCLVLGSCWRGVEDPALAVLEGT